MSFQDNHLRDQREKEELCSDPQNFFRDAAQIFFKESAVANPNRVNWQLLRKEKWGDTIGRWIKAHPEDKILVDYHANCLKRLEKEKDQNKSPPLTANFDAVNQLLAQQSELVGLPLVAVMDTEEKKIEVPPELKMPVPVLKRASVQVSPISTKEELIESANVDRLPPEEEEDEDEEDCKTPLVIDTTRKQSDMPVIFPDNLFDQEEEEEEKKEKKPQEEMLSPKLISTEDHTMQSTAESGSSLSMEQVHATIESTLLKAMQELMPNLQNTMLQDMRNQLNPLQQQVTNLTQQLEALKTTTTTTTKPEEKEIKTEYRPPFEKKQKKACRHCQRHDEKEEKDVYDEDVHREWDYRLKKWEHEGMPLPKNFNLDDARQFDKAVVRERNEAELSEKEFVQDREKLLVSLAHGIEKTSKAIGIGGEALNKLGKRAQKLIQEEHALQRGLKRMFHEEKGRHTTSASASLVTPILSLVIDTIARNETPHVAAAVGKGIQNVREVMAGGPEGERAKKNLKRTTQTIGTSLLHSIVDPDEEEDHGESEADEKDYIDETLAQTFAKNGWRRDEMAQFKGNPELFIKKTTQKMAKYATDPKTKQYWQEAQKELEENNNNTPSSNKPIYAHDYKSNEMKRHTEEAITRQKYLELVAREQSEMNQETPPKEFQFREALPGEQPRILPAMKLPISDFSQIQSHLGKIVKGVKETIEINQEMQSENDANKESLRKLLETSFPTS